MTGQEPPLHTGTIYDFMRYSTHDGPGIRTTVFFKGCPLKCAWCHNPEGQSPEAELFTWTDRCIECGNCIESCPLHAIMVRDGVVVTSRETCRPCVNCQETCQARARELVGKKMTVTEVIEEIEKDTVFYDESGGGVTLSGGEPLTQPTFLKELLKICREKRIHSAVETCGFAQSETMMDMSANVDLWLYDLKIMDDSKHMKHTGSSNNLILHNLRLLSRVHNHIVVRFPLVPDLNDDASNILEMGRFISSLESIREIHVLPYHSGAIEKYKRLGKRYNFTKTQSPSKEKLSEVADQLEKFGLKVKFGG